MEFLPGSLSDLRFTARFLPFLLAALLAKCSFNPAKLRFRRLASGKNHQKSPRNLKIRQNPGGTMIRKILWITTLLILATVPLGGQRITDKPFSDLEKSRIITNLNRTLVQINQNIQIQTQAIDKIEQKIKRETTLSPRMRRFILQHIKEMKQEATFINNTWVMIKKTVKQSSRMTLNFMNNANTITSKTESEHSKEVGDERGQKNREQYRLIFNMNQQNEKRARLLSTRVKVGIKKGWDAIDNVMKTSRNALTAQIQLNSRLAADTSRMLMQLSYTIHLINFLITEEVNNEINVLQ